MFDLIDELCTSLKQEDVYLDYMKAKATLNQHEDLLLRFKEAKTKYLENQAYAKYINLDEQKREVLALASEVTHLDAYQNYHRALEALNTRLETITAIIFDGLTVEVEDAKCVLSPENTNDAN